MISLVLLSAFFQLITSICSKFVKWRPQHRTITLKEHMQLMSYDVGSLVEHTVHYLELKVNVQAYIIDVGSLVEHTVLM